jgi:hypothetical protein
MCRVGKARQREQPAGDRWKPVEIRDDLDRLLDRPVDLVERSTVVQRPNWIRRREILGTARTIYSAG